MMLDNRIERDIDACYEAVFDPARWTDTLHGLARSLDAACMMFYPGNPDASASDPRNPSREFTEMPSSRDYGDLLAEYLKNRWYLGHYRAERGIPLLRAGRRVVTEHDLATDEERRRLRHYNELYMAFGFPGFAMVGLNVQGDLWAVPLLRAKGQGHFTPEDSRVLARIAPHFRRMISLSETLALAQGRTALATLDALSCAAFLLDSVGNVLSHNSIAERILGDGLCLSGRRLRASNRASELELRKLIHQAITNRRPSHLDASRAVAIRRDSKRPLLVEALPTAGIIGDVFQSTSAIVIVKNFEDRPRTTSDQLRGAFSLTPAETRVAVLLATGAGPGTIADSLHLSKETVRAHMKMIFAKTGTHRQGELVALTANMAGSLPMT